MQQRNRYTAVEFMGVNTHLRRLISTELADELLAVLFGTLAAHPRGADSVPERINEEALVRWLRRRARSLGKRFDREAAALRAAQDLDDPLAA